MSRHLDYEVREKYGYMYSEGRTPHVPNYWDRIRLGDTNEVVAKLSAACRTIEASHLDLPPEVADW